MSESSKRKAAQTRRCPDCRKFFKFISLAATPSFPFCSERCKLADLGTWLSEGYQVVEDVPLLQPSLDDMPDDQYWA